MSREQGLLVYLRETFELSASVTFTLWMVSPTGGHTSSGGVVVFAVGVTVGNWSGFFFVVVAVVSGVVIRVFVGDRMVVVSVFDEPPPCPLRDKQGV